MISRLVAALALLALPALPSAALCCPTHDVVLPTGPGNGAPKEVTVLLDTPFVKLVSITLRKGTKLTKHAAKEAITLQAISGSGKLLVGTTTDSLAPGHVLLVAPGVEHEVVPDGAGELVVLVHFLKSAAATAKPDVACEHDAPGAAGKPAAGHEH